MTNKHTLSWGVRKNLLHLAALSVEDAYHWLKENYFRLVLYVVLAIAASVAISLTLNNLGWMQGNVLLGALAFIGAGVFAFQPSMLLVVYGANRATKSATPTLKQYTRMVAHVLLFATIFFLVMATLGIESLLAAVGLLLVLTGLGVASYLWPTGRWYRKIAWFILTAELLMFGYHTWVYVHPQQSALASAERAAVERQGEEDVTRINALAAIRAERALTSTEAMEYNQLAQAQAERTDPRSNLEEVTRVVTIHDLAPKQISGVRSGWYTLSVSTGDVAIGGSSYQLVSYVRINGKKADERVYVSEGVPVRLSYTLAFNGSVVPVLDSPQNVAVSFTPSPL